MSISLTVNQFRSSVFSVANPGGTPNTTAPLTASPGNGAILRTRVNPNNNREVGVMCLADNGGSIVNANVSAVLADGTHSSSTGFTPVAAPVPGSVTAGNWSAESDPPDWML
jgi:hypothetical protein